MTPNNQVPAPSEADNSDKQFMSADSFSNEASAAKSYEACHAVLNTTELLEAIILCLPPITIFGVRRVSTKWLDTILSSTLVQQRTCLSAKPITERCVGRATTNSQASTRMPLYSEKIVPAPEGDYKPLRYVDGVVKEYYTMPVTPTTLCPLAEGLFNEQGLDCGVFSFGSQRCTLDATNLIGNPGSWQTIFLTSPSCTSVGLKAVVELDITPQKFITADRSITNECGITIGKIVDHVVNEPLELPTSQYDLVDIGYDPEPEPEPKSIKEVLNELKAALIGDFNVVSCNMIVNLSGMVIPTDGERERVRNGGIKFTDTPN